MKTKTKVEKSTVIHEDVATLSPPAKVTLPTLTRKKAKPSPVSVEGLPNMAKRISKILPMDEPKKKEDNSSDKKAAASENRPIVEPERIPQPIYYSRPVRSFD
jgi:hypothetical protein